MTLPNDPVERMRIIHENKVKRTYIPPTWVGTKQFSDKDVEHEVMTEEIGLCQL